VKYPCSRCRNVVCEDKRTLTLHLCKVGFTPNYHGESVHQTASVAGYDDMTGDDMMDEMFDAIRLNLETNSKDPFTP
jgi:hypothetical protein